MTASDPRGPAPGGKAPSPLDRLLDLAVYGPVGLALTARELLPQWAETGRRQVAARVTAARAVGRLAVDQGARQATQAVRRLAGQGGAVLRGAGVAPTDRGTSSDGAGSDGASPAAAPPSEATGGVIDASVPTAAVPTAPLPGIDETPDVAADLDPAQLAIPGYDTLSASQVVQRLPGLSADELEAVRNYELAGRARKTILLKVAQVKPTS